MWISILFDIAYLLLAVMLAPLIAYRMYFKGKYRDTIGQRLGVVDFPQKPGAIWLHGVSVGEIKAAQPLVQKLQEMFSPEELVISATSTAGRNMAARLYPCCRIICFPLDFSWSVRRYLRYLQPRLIILLEWELWPNFLLWSHRSQIPVLLVNGRLSTRSFRRFKRYARWLFPKLTVAIRCFSVQAEIYRQRLLQLGVADHRIQVNGNLKFDAGDNQLHVDRQQQLFEQLGVTPEHLVLVAGSTHDPEEKILIASYLELRDDFPQLRLIIVPRHPQRADAIAVAIRQVGLLAIKKTQLPASYCFDANQIIIGDVMGELAQIYTLATIAFVGGSLIPHGGQNFIEPASLGKVVLCGPYMDNFPDIGYFVEQNAVVQLAKSEELVTRLRLLLNQPQQLRDIGQKAEYLVRQNKGSCQRNLQLCLETIQSANRNADNCDR